MQCRIDARRNDQRLILHLAGVPNEKRLETFATFGFKMREGGGALETAS